MVLSKDVFCNNSDRFPGELEKNNLVHRFRKAVTFLYNKLSSIYRKGPELTGILPKAPEKRMKKLHPSPETAFATTHNY